MTIRHTIHIDFADTNTEQEIHDRLAEAFGFPEYYGKNWDAFDECIRDLDTPPVRIAIRGFEALEKKFPGEARLLMECLHDYTKSPEGQGVEIEMQ